MPPLQGNSQISYPAVYRQPEATSMVGDPIPLLGSSCFAAPFLPFSSRTFCFKATAVLISHLNETSSTHVQQDVTNTGERHVEGSDSALSGHRATTKSHFMTTPSMHTGNCVKVCPSRQFLFHQGIPSWWQVLEAGETTWHIVRLRRIRVRETPIEDVLSPSSPAIHSFSHWHLPRE